MRLFRVLTLSVMVAGCATLAFADAQPTPDPHVIINDPVGYFTDVGLEFTFTTNDSGGGFFSFTNDSGVTFANLELYVPDLPTSDMTCSGSAFGFAPLNPVKTAMRPSLISGEELEFPTWVALPLTWDPRDGLAMPSSRS